MSIKLVSDSSANLYSLEGIDFKSADMVISTDEKEYRDNENLDVKQMVDDLESGRWSDEFIESLLAWYRDNIVDIIGELIKQVFYLRLCRLMTIMVRLM